VKEGKKGEREGERKGEKERKREREKERETLTCQTLVQCHRRIVTYLKSY
jgi:hypothetical protein